VYELAGSPVDKTYFVDGGVLDNFPFRHAVRAIAGKPAATEVERRLLFIEPDPAKPRGIPDGTPPGFGSTIWAGLSKLPRRQPIGDALDELMLYNRRVRRVKQMIDTVEPTVIASVMPLLALPYDKANQEANTGAIESNGVAFQAYLHLKLISVVEGMATAIAHLLRYPPTTTQALFVERALLNWADAQGLLQTESPISAEQRAFLRTFDLGYGQRRLAFVIGRLKKHYKDGVDRGRLNALKQALYELQSELKLVLPQAEFLQASLESIFGATRLDGYIDEWRLHGFVEDSAAQLAELRRTLGAYLDETLDDFGTRAWQALEAGTADLPADVRDDLRARYLGFPYWDATTYPARALSDVGELDEVQVVRVSPLDSRRLVPATAAKDKLHGVALGHFGAFFRRSWRENDYLWGRLDGAERLLWLLGDTTDVSVKDAFAAVAAEEAGALKKARGLVERVQSYVEAEPAKAPAQQGQLTPI
jgi:patatin-related protein